MITEDVPVQATLNLQVRAFLQGAYDTSTELMRDDLRSASYIPSQSPYAGTSQTLNSSLLNITGRNAIVDWVLLELRNANTPSTVEHTYPALLQRDGDLVDPVSGDVKLKIEGLSEGNYHISVRHRNHLGVMTANARSLQQGFLSVVDFTTTTTAVRGEHARSEAGGLAFMWAGDANHDERIIYSGPSSDQSKLQVDVLLAPGNTSYSFNYVLWGYSDSDLDLNGKTVYSGPGSDTSHITSSVFLNPSNSSYSFNYIVQGGMRDVVQ